MPMNDLTIIGVWQPIIYAIGVLKRTRGKFDMVSKVDRQFAIDELISLHRRAKTSIGQQISKAYKTGLVPKGTKIPYFTGDRTRKL